MSRFVSSVTFPTHPKVRCCCRDSPQKPPLCFFAFRNGTESDFRLTPGGLKREKRPAGKLAYPGKHHNIESPVGLHTKTPPMGISGILVLGTGVSGGCSRGLSQAYLLH